MTAGSPYFTRTAGAETYGGGADKADYGSPGAVNARTDLAAEQLQRIAADLAGCARVAPFLRLKVQCNDTSPAAPTVVLAVTPAEFRTTSYEGDNAPAGHPTLSRLGDGQFRITMPATFADDAGSSAAPVVRFPHAQAVSSTAAARVVAFTSTTVDIYVTQPGSATAVLDAVVMVSIA